MKLVSQTFIGQLSGSELLRRQKCIQIQIEIQLSGHFLHSRFELTWIEVIDSRVEGDLTISA